VGKTDEYRLLLRGMDDWEAYLIAESGLHGPRANLELVQAVADEGDPATFRRYAAVAANDPASSPAREFLALCAAVGFGRLLAEGDGEALPLLEELALDSRWRVREGVAIGLQRLGKQDMRKLLGIAAEWSRGERLLQRAAIAAVCEPPLLKDEAEVGPVLAILDTVTASLAEASDRLTENFRVLRQALAYCWSVAVAASPRVGKPAMEGWLGNPDPDVRWVMRENLKKARLGRMDTDWVRTWSERVSSAS
jgi:hypothetical protein